MQTFAQKHTKGFTLVETLIAIAILMAAIGGAFGIAQKSLSSSAFSKNQTTAFFLAAEGLELVRNVRDNVALYNKAHSDSQVDWLEPFKYNCGTDPLTASNCYFDLNPASVDLNVGLGGVLKNVTDLPANCGAVTLSGPHACRLKLVTVGNSTYYTSVTSSTAGSIFFRKITIDEVSAGSGSGSDGSVWDKKEAVVTSTVYWLGEKFQVKETLSNWNQ